MIEEWRPVVGLETTHIVSNLGKVKSIRRGKLITVTLCDAGYPRVTLRDTKLKKLRTFRIHRLVALAFLPNPEGLEMVNHIDGVKTNSSLENLEWVSRSENVKHAIRIGLIRRDATHNPAFKGWVQAEKDGFGFVMAGNHQMEALGFRNSDVFACLNGRQKSHRGFNFARIAPAP